MPIGGTILVVAVVIIAIWILVEVKRMRHKIFAILLIALILFSYISTAIIFKGQDIDFKTAPGIITAGKLYFSWLGSIFVNLKTVTTNAIKMDWKSNKSAEDIKKEPIIDFGKS